MVALNAPFASDTTESGVVTAAEPSNVILIAEFGANVVPFTVTTVPAAPLEGESWTAVSRNTAVRAVFDDIETCLWLEADPVSSQWSNT